MIDFTLGKGIRKGDLEDACYEIPGSYKVTFNDFEFDLAKIFSGTIAQYLKDVNWMKRYIDMFWENCLEKEKQYLLIYSLPPIHLDSYFLMKKAKENGGKCAHWQHGGLYGYTAHFFQYAEDYKNSDHFLSFGKSSIDKTTKRIEGSHAKSVDLGSKVMYSKPASRHFSFNKATSTKGLFIPVVVGSFYSPSFIKWDGNLQFSAMKDIVDYFASNESHPVEVKGFKGHRPHSDLKNYINTKSCDHLSFTDIPLNKVLANKPEFVVLDNPSTPLLQTLAQYNGPIFLLVNQESWKIIDEALDLLKRRVVYCESVDELQVQLRNFFQTGNLGSVDISDTSFMDVYLKRFSYKKYEAFLDQAILIRSYGGI